jgi:hypothetical protein
MPKSIISGFRQGLSKSSSWPWQADAAATPAQEAAFLALSGQAPQNLRVFTLIRDVQPDDPLIADLQAKFDADSAASPRPLRAFSAYLPAGFSLPDAEPSAGIRAWSSSSVLFYTYTSQPRFDLVRITVVLLVSAMESTTHPVPSPADCVEINVSIEPGNGIGPYDDGTQKWFRFKVRLNPDMTGNATDGWTDPGGSLRVEIQQSLDLQTWNMGQVRSVTGATPETESDGTISYLCESTVPFDWRQKMVDMVIRQQPHWFYVDYQRDRDITELRLDGATIPLPNYPYSIPSDISALTADLASAGYPGCSVDYDPDTWALTIPDILVSDYTVDAMAAIDPPQEYINSFQQTDYYYGWTARMENVRIGSGFSNGYTRPKRQFFRAKVSIA